MNMGQKTIEREVQTNGFEDDFRMKWVSVQRIRIDTHFLLLSAENFMKKSHISGVVMVY